MDDVSEHIYGYPEDSTSGVPRADRFHCERCADLYLSLSELGFCITLGDDMRDLVKEYAVVYGKRKMA